MTRIRTIPFTYLLCTLCLVQAACSESGDTTGQRVVIGDTTIVRSGTPIWGDSASLIEEVSIGDLDGPDEYQFGDFVDVGVDGDGGIYVFDGQDPALRYYDSSGRYLWTLGRDGAGPGEYRDASMGLAVRSSDGRVVMQDPRNSRLNVYEIDGSHSVTWPVGNVLYTSNALTLDTADHMYLKIMTGMPERNKPWPIALLHLDDKGQIIDTIVPPGLPGEPERLGGAFGVSKVWAASPLGGVVVGVNDEYRLEHYRPDGSVLRIEREVEPVPVLPGEREEYEAADAWRRRYQGQFMTTDPQSIPGNKPAYRSILVGGKGRIWVKRYAEARKGEPVQFPAPAGFDEPAPARYWHEPIVFDVFEPDGTFLGSLEVPDKTTLSVFRGDRVWGVRKGSFGEAQVVGFRISH